MSNLIRTASLEIDAEDAARSLARKLGLEPGQLSDNLPDRAEWRRASDVQRLMWLGEWLKSTAYQMADAVESAPLQSFSPIGGAKYAHQND